MIRVIFWTMQQKRDNSNLVFNSIQCRYNPLTEDVETVHIFASIHSLFMIAWYTIFKSDNTMRLDRFDQMSISQVLANTVIKNFNGLLLFTVTFATILFMQAICTILKISEGIEQNDQKTNKNRWTKRTEKKFVNISIFACLLAWISAIFLVFCDIYHLVVY